MRLPGALTGAVAALAVVLAGCSSGGSVASPGPPPPDVPVELAEFYTQRIAWHGCGGALECGTLRVPKDYGRPGLGTMDLALLRAPATSRQRIGSLVVNPGGPGASGVDYARAARAIVGPDVLRRFDIVGFDPRGVGRSQPVDCLSDGQLDELLGAPVTATTSEEGVAGAEVARRMGIGCRAKSDDVARWMATESTARDLDVLRAALGEERLHYLGKSFGTAIATLFAEQFPQRVGRMVLDGPFPVSLSSEELALGQAIGFEQALQRFVAHCLAERGCPLRSRSLTEGVSEIQGFLAGLRDSPLPSGDGRLLTEPLGIAAVVYHLYFPPGDWQLLRQGLAAGFAGDGSRLLSMLDRRLRRGSDGRYEGNTMEAFYAVSCLDRPAADLAELPALADRLARSAPTFGQYLAWGEAVCAQWPYPPVSRPRVVTAKGSPPILVVATEHDPATPYAWGLLLAEQLPAAVLVSYNGDGHTAYRRGSACVDGVIGRFLLSGAVPDRDPRCGY